MFRISLINMPFAATHLPSIALTQLKSMVDTQYGKTVSVDIHYVNHEFAHYLGLPLYNWMVESNESQNGGLGDWFFRQVAFPETTDNTEAYFRRYFPYRTDQWEKQKATMLSKRKELESYLSELIVKYDFHNSDVIGFTSMFMQNGASFAMARKIKDHNPKVISAMGGANCETPMGQEIIRNVKQIDYVFSGPGLISFPDFVGHCMRQEKAECSSIKGVFSRSNYLLQPPLTIGAELDINEPVPLDYGPFLDTVARSFPNREVKPNLLFETSRGCWWGEKAHCTFCGLNGQTMNYRAMDPAKAVEHISSLFQYADRCSRLESVDNILPKSYLKEVFDKLDTPSNMTLFYEVKADLSEEDVATLARARVMMIQPGIESMATSTLKLMRKGTSVFTNLLLLKNCAVYDIIPGWNLLIGFPGEGEDVYKKYLQDLPLLVHLYPPSGVFPVRFDRYSPYFTKAKEYQLDLRPMDYYPMVYPFSSESLANLAYYFADKNLRADYLRTMIKWIGPIREKIKTWITQWSVSDFATRPQLHFKENGSSHIVLDTRSGQTIEHKLDATGKQLLQQLAKPQRAQDLAQEISSLTSTELEQQLIGLKELGLIFQEGERYMSLVLPKAPPWSKAETSAI